MRQQIEPTTTQKQKIDVMLHSEITQTFRNTFYGNIMNATNVGRRGPVLTKQRLLAAVLDSNENAITYAEKLNAALPRLIVTVEENYVYTQKRC